MRLGSRASALALAQARLVADLLGGAEIVPISTAGDRDKDARFDQIGDGRGVFTREIERALLDGEIDAAVHSAKDLTGEMPEGLVLAAVPERGDPRDACCGPYALAGRDTRGRQGGDVVGPPLRPSGGAARRPRGGAAARQRRHATAQARRR